MPRVAGREKTVVHTAWLPKFFDQTCDPENMRTAYRCRVYPDAARQAVLNRTFGCVRVVWNRTLAARQNRWHAERQGTSYAQSDRALTAMKKEPALAFLSEVSCVPLQQALRRDFLHRTTTRLVRENDMIAIEDLAVKNMVRNHRLARAISDCSWGEFRRQLEYKCQRYGRDLVMIDRWYPSSKTCSACGHLLAQLSLSTRHWRCPACGARHHRDINAAKNILAAGRAVARESPGDACGADVRHSGNPRMRSAVKQEPRPARAGTPVLQGGE